MGMQRRDEVETFKTDINLSEYAASIDYAIDRQESSQRSIVMRRASDKITIARNTNYHYIYYSFRDTSDNGTIIDFIQNRHIQNFGKIRKELRPWIGAETITRPKPSLSHYRPTIPTTEKNRQKVILEFSQQQEIVDRHVYLTDERKIPEACYRDKRFAGRVYTDEYKNAVFPHYDKDGLCGFEKKNRDYTSFSTGGEKTAWISNCFKDDERLVIVESGIEALSHYALFHDDTARYLSLGGSWSDQAMEVAREVISRFKGEIVLAFNNDAAGWELEDKFMGAIGKELPIVVQYPDQVSHDWNDQLMGQTNG